MTPPAKKRRTGDKNEETNGHASDDQGKTYTAPFTPVTFEAKKEWQGFCEIESEPAFFNVMLKDFGVKGIRVQEVFGLDDESLAMLGQPVYGMIFLFRYKSPNENKQEAICPENVWFANQTHEYACATVSLLNIVNNIPNADLGEALQAFKDFTEDFTPALRGDQIGNFEFVKQIHNSFARKMDMMCIDLGLENRFDDRKKPAPKKPKQLANKKKKVITEDVYEDDDSAYHFIAYVPVDSEVWNLDGLDRQPQKLGTYDDVNNWISVATPFLAARMAAYTEDEIEFALLALVRDPILTHLDNLAVNRKCLQAVESRLDHINPDGDESKIRGGDTPITSADFHAVTEEAIMAAMFPESIKEKLQAESPAELIDLRHELSVAQNGLLSSIAEEEASDLDDRRKATERREDYSLLIHRWLSMLAEKEGVIKELIEETS